jgi:hypothetical protein
MAYFGAEKSERRWVPASALLAALGAGCAEQASVAKH